mgnify:CR=1 FL=1
MSNFEADFIKILKLWKIIKKKSVVDGDKEIVFSKAIKAGKTYLLFRCEEKPER